MIKAFKEFLTRGNLIDLAVAFIMGTAFGALIHSLVTNMIMPVVGRLIGGVDFANLYINLSGEVYPSAAAAREAGAAAVYYGAFINAVVVFLIIALVMFALVRVSQNMKKPAPVAAPTTKECPQCRTSIPLAAVRCPNCTSQLE